MSSSHERRGGGLHYGVAVTVALLTALDLFHLHALAGQPLSIQTSTPLVWGALLVWAWALGSVLTPLVAAFSVTASGLTRWFERRRFLATRPRLASAFGVALLCLPAVLVVSWALFQGRGVGRHPTIALVGPVLAAPLLVCLIIASWIVREWLDERGTRARRMAWLLLLTIVAGLFVVDARLFVGLYEYLHLALSLLALVASVTVVRVILPKRAGTGPSTRGGRLRLLGFSLGSAVVALSALVVLLRAAPEARSDLVERSLYASRGLTLLSPVLPLGRAPALATQVLTLEDLESTYLVGLSRPTESTGRRPDILLFSIDAVNADRFPGRGYNPEVMPNITKLLSTSTRFDRAYTTVPETQYAVPALIMSTTRDVGPDGTERDLEETTASALRRVGYGTYWVYEAKDLFQGGGVLNNLDFGGFDGRYGIDDDRAFASSERVIEILEAHRSRPLFIWTHIFAPHAPYTPPRQFRLFGDSRSDLYDGELRAADAYIGQVIDYLRDQGRLDNTIIIITADHGEWSGEGGRFGHGADVKERTVNIPLLFMGPGIQRGVTLQEPVSIVDIGPTIVELARGATPQTFEGQSLIPALQGEPFERGLVVANTEGHGSTAAILDDYKLVFNRAKTVIRLYNLSNDRRDEHDLSTAQPERVREMLAQVAALDLERTVAERVGEDGRDGAIDAYRSIILGGSDSEAERTLSARALGWIESERSREVLVELLGRGETESLSAAVRRWLAAALVRLGAGRQADAVWGLVEEERDLMVRVQSLRALLSTPRATEAVTTWGDHSNVHMRRATASLIAGPRAKARPGRAQSEQFLADDDDLVRALAVSNMERLSGVDRGAALRQALDDNSPGVRLAAARQCGRTPRGCLRVALDRVSRTEDIGERIAILTAVTPALNKQPALWAELLEGPPSQRALAFEGLGRSTGEFDDLLLGAFEQERDDRAREALIRAAGHRRLKGARASLIRQHGEANFALGQAATDALRQIGLEKADVPELVSVFPRATQMQTKVNLLHLFGIIDEIDDPRVFEIAERMRATPRKDHHLIRALVETYSRLTDPRAERFRVDHVMYTNFGYQFWLYGYSMRPEQPRAGDEIELKLLWSIRWNQPRNAMNFIHIIGGPKQIPLDRRTVAGRAVHSWPRCRIVVDELTLQLPEKGRRIRVMTGWTRGGRLNIIYGEHDNQRRALITSFKLHQ